LNEPAALQHLVTCFRDGDTCVFEDFESHVFAVCYRRARRLGAKHDEAEDVAQEVLARIWLTRARSFDPQRGSLEGWLGVSCANRLKDLWKRKDRQRQLETEAGIDVATTPSPEEVVLQREDGEEVRAFLQRLTSLQRAVLDKVSAGHTNQEIARELGIPEPRVRSVKFRALQRMRQLLRRGEISPRTPGLPDRACGRGAAPGR
jgi:RNA polymerase sigma-70 factor (ECF subfamily)